MASKENKKLLRGRFFIKKHKEVPNALWGLLFNLVALDLTIQENDELDFIMHILFSAVCCSVYAGRKMEVAKK